MGEGEKKNRKIIKGHPGNDEDLNQRDDGENGKVRSDGRGSAKEEDREEIQGDGEDWGRGPGQQRDGATQRSWPSRSSSFSRKSISARVSAGLATTMRKKLLRVPWGW